MDTISMRLGIADISVALLVIGLSMPLVKGSVKMNRFYGIRFAKSYESEEDWRKINKYGGKQLIIWSIILAIFGIVTLYFPLEGNTGLAIAVLHAPAILLFSIIPICSYARNL